MKNLQKIFLAIFLVLLIIYQPVSAAPRKQPFDHVYVAEDCGLYPGLNPCYTNVVTAIEDLNGSSTSTLTFVGINYYDNSENPIRSGPTQTGAYPITFEGYDDASRIVGTGNQSGVPIFEVNEGNVAFRNITIICSDNDLTAVRLSADGLDTDGNLAMQNVHINGCISAINPDGGIGNAVIIGNTFDSTGVAGATPFNCDTDGSILAFVNNFIGFEYSIRVQNAGIVNLSHNWWGVYDDDNQPIYESGILDETWWNTRLGAEVVAWAAGPAPGGAALGIAQLTGGTDGINVIVSHGRNASNAPFGNGIEPWVSRMCSDYYDFFTINATSSDPYSIILPVDTDTACHEEVWAKRDVFFIPASPTNDDQFDRCASSPSYKSCWPLINAATLPSASITHAGSNLRISGLSYLDLGGTPIVAGSFEGTNPTAVTLIDFSTRSSKIANLAISMLGFGVVAILVFQTFKKRNK